LLDLRALYDEGQRLSKNSIVFVVVAQTDGPGTRWRVVLRTPDKAYAQATLEQFREAGVSVRVVTFVSRQRRKPPRK
jgi:hypothetical protein